MKKLILIIAIALQGIAATAQVDTTSTQNPVVVTVKDTSYLNDERLIYLVNTIIPAVQKFFEESALRAKVSGNEVTFQQESEDLLNQLKGIVSNYANNFIQVTDVAVEPDAIVAEFNSLNEKIQTLQSDPDIKYIEAMREFQSIQERQAKLAAYYDQIEKNKPTEPVVTPKAWIQPTGAHDAYKKGDKVLYQGKTWESTMDANVWAPGVAGWREI